MVIMMILFILIGEKEHKLGRARESLFGKMGLKKKDGIVTIK